MIFLGGIDEYCNYYGTMVVTVMPTIDISYVSPGQILLQTVSVQHYVKDILLSEKRVVLMLQLVY